MRFFTDAERAEFESPTAMCRKIKKPMTLVLKYGIIYYIIDYILIDDEYIIEIELQ